MKPCATSLACQVAKTSHEEGARNEGIRRPRSGLGFRVSGFRALVD